MTMNEMNSNGYSMIITVIFQCFQLLGALLVLLPESKVENFDFLGLAVLGKKNHYLRVSTEHRGGVGVGVGGVASVST